MITIHNNKKVRLFVAVPVPEIVVRCLKDIQNSLKKKVVRASLASISTMHLTLKFIGETPGENLGPIIEALERTALVNGAFELAASGVGVFPSVKKARVIWAGVISEKEILSKLYQDLEFYLEKAGIPRSEKRYSPHLTLARLKGRADSRQLLELLRQFQNHRSETFECFSIDLYKSVLKPSGAVHTLVSRAVLKS